MSADAVLEDALREAGYSRLTAWHLRCVESCLSGPTRTGPDAPGMQAHSAWQRLASDVRAGSLDAAHAEAQWEDARVTAQRSAARATREQLAAHADTASNPAESRICSLEGVVAGASPAPVPTVRVEVWRRRHHGHRIVVLRLRPVAARRGRLTWVEEEGEEWAGGSDESARDRAERILGWLTGSPGRAGLPALTGDETSP